MQTGSPRRLLAAFATVAMLAIAGRALGQTLWYGGDVDLNGSASNNTFGGIQSRVLDDFVVPVGQRWHVTGLLSNNMVTPPFGTVPTTAVWSIRRNVAAGNPGEILFQGNSAATVTTTGRANSSYSEYRVVVSGLSIDLDAGTYFVQVSPVTPVIGNFYMGAGLPKGRVGIPGPSVMFQQVHIQTTPPMDYVDTVPDSMGTVGSFGVLGQVIAEVVAVPAVSGVAALALACVVAAFGLAMVRRVA